MIHESCKYYFKDKIEKTKMAYSSLADKEVAVNYIKTCNLCGLNPSTIIIKDNQPLCSSFKSMKYSLRRLSDGAGDSGIMSDLLYKDEDKKEIVIEHNARPKVNSVMRVGSIYARTMSWQDWWQTNLITEILIDDKNYVKFKTNNSVYEWRKI